MSWPWYFGQVLWWQLKRDVDVIRLLVACHFCCPVVVFLKEMAYSRTYPVDSTTAPAEITFSIESTRQPVEESTPCQNFQPGNVLVVVSKRLQPQEPENENHGECKSRKPPLLFRLSKLCQL